MREGCYQKREAEAWENTEIGVVKMKCNDGGVGVGVVFD